MKRFSTPDHTFYLPFSAADIKRLKLTYEQNEKVLLEKAETDMTPEENAWNITLTQEETGMFSEGEATAQIHFLLNSGKAGHTEPYVLYVEDVQHAEVLK